MAKFDLNLEYGYTEHSTRSRDRKSSSYAVRLCETAPSSLSLAKLVPEKGLFQNMQRADSNMEVCLQWLRSGLAALLPSHHSGILKQGEEKGSVKHVLSGLILAQQ